MTITLTLNAILAHHPCYSGWKKLLAYLGKKKADDEPFPLLTVLESNGLADAVWCFRALGHEHHKFLVAFACDCAERALKYARPGDDRPRIAIETTLAWLRGEATLEEVKKAAALAEAAWAAAALAAAAEAAAAEAAAAEAAEAAAEAAPSREAERTWQTTHIRNLLTGDTNA